MSSLWNSPLHVAGLTLKNRIVFPPMSTKFCAPGGGITERLTAYYEARARGGAGMIIVEATCIHASGSPTPRWLHLTSDEQIPQFTELASRIKKYEAAACIQLAHTGRAASAQATGYPILLVSHIPGVTPHQDSRIIDEDDIQRLADCWGKAALRAKKAGFDAVELHGAHGYLLSQFLSPFTNRRTDRYGGCLENRMRFPLYVLKTVREYVGPDFPVGYRLSVEEKLDDAGLYNGLTLDDSLIFCRQLVENGISWLHVTVGLRETNYMVSPPSCVPKGWIAELAGTVRTAINRAVPVIAVNRIADEHCAETILQKGEADLVAMGRALIADPDLPNKASRDEADQIFRCIGCNDGCVGGSARGTGVSCALNPLTGFEGRYDLSVTSMPKKIVCVGGGPAGMSAALYAARRGHYVSLYEKQPALGGLLNIAAVPPFKGDIALYPKTMDSVLRAAGVEIHLGHELDVEEIRALAPDVLLLATGSVPVVPAFAQGDPRIMTADRILGGEVEAGKRTLIIGGGLIGCETMEFLVENGHEVVLVEMQPVLAKDMEGRTRHYMMRRMKQRPVKVLLETRVNAVSPQGEVTVCDASGAESSLGLFDTIILAIGYRPDRRLADKLTAAGIPYTAIGDCEHVEKILTATAAGLRAAAAIN